MSACVLHVAVEQDACKQTQEKSATMRGTMKTSVKSESPDASERSTPLAAEAKPEQRAHEASARPQAPSTEGGAARAALGLQQDGLRVRLALHRPEERAPSGEGASAAG